MSDPTPDPQRARPRRQLVADRIEHSLAWRMIYWAGSLKLALILLATIAAACAIATFTESNFSTKVAQHYIYKAPWFQVWLVVLCVNLFAVTLTRWPWEKKHIGFVVTHYGIITLLIGAMVGMHSGYEGNVTLHKNAPPVAEVITNHTIIEIVSPTNLSLYTLPFDPEMAHLGQGHTRIFFVPGTSLKIVADQFAPSMMQEEKLVASDAPEASPGLLLELSNPTMGQTLQMPLALEGGLAAEQDLFGLAHISLLPALPETGTPPHEIQMVFAKYAPIVTGPITSGVAIQLGANGNDVTMQIPGSPTGHYLLKDILGKPIMGPTNVVIVEKYWPDFFMQNGEPATRSENPNNPAVLVSISKDEGSAHGQLTLDLALQGGKAAYQLLRAGQIYAAGQVAPGEIFPLGWANWSAKIVQTFPKAVVAREYKPGPPPAQGMTANPGFRAFLQSADGKAGPPQWIESGRLITLNSGTDSVRFGYGLETKPLPFSLRLVDFQVPRDEGTDTPANFLATIEFQDGLTGKTKTDVARMNYPASFPGTLWSNMTGINYKFSQAEWNPRDLDETTLQVLYDPGWMLKWIGSLGIIIGIATMFYWKPR